LGCCGLARTIDEEQELLDVVDQGTRRWSRIGSLCHLLREPQGFLAHGLNLHCSCACAVETRSAHLRSLLQDRRAWLHFRCATSALLPHQRPPTCMRVVGCLAYARACGNELSRPSVLRRASDSRRVAPASTSAWVKGARRAWLHRISSELVTPDRCLRFAASPSGSSHHNHSSAFVRTMVCLH
jgi:hypothetical protein